MCSLLFVVCASAAGSSDTPCSQGCLLVPRALTPPGRRRPRPRCVCTLSDPPRPDAGGLMAVGSEGPLVSRPGGSLTSFRPGSFQFPRDAGSVCHCFPKWFFFFRLCLPFRGLREGAPQFEGVPCCSCAPSAPGVSARWFLRRLCVLTHLSPGRPTRLGCRLLPLPDTAVPPEAPSGPAPSPPPPRSACSPCACGRGNGSASGVWVRQPDTRECPGEAPGGARAASRASPAHGHGSSGRSEALRTQSLFGARPGLACRPAGPGWNGTPLG